MQIYSLVRQERRELQTFKSVWIFQCAFWLVLLVSYGCWFLFSVASIPMAPFFSVYVLGVEVHLTTWLISMIAGFSLDMLNHFSCFTRLLEVSAFFVGCAILLGGLVGGFSVLDLVLCMTWLLFRADPVQCLVISVALSMKMGLFLVLGALPMVLLACLVMDFIGQPPQRVWSLVLAVLLMGLRRPEAWVGMLNFGVYTFVVFGSASVIAAASASLCMLADVFELGKQQDALPAREMEAPGADNAASAHKLSALNGSKGVHDEENKEEKPSI